MNLSEAILQIVTQLDNWRGINEAQTRQVIILRILQVLGWEIWNPLEVAAEKNSGGGGGAYIPDFTLAIDSQPRLILEVKALGKDFSENDKIQAVNYANSAGLRWAILSNGNVWMLFDNNLIHLPSAQRLSVTIELGVPKSDIYLNDLLSPHCWKYEDFGEQIAKNAKFILEDIRIRQNLDKIEIKLRKEIEEGFTSDEKGLRKAIELTLDANERELAQEKFTELARRILGYLDPIKDTVNILRDCIQQASLQGHKVSDFKARLQGEEIDAHNWRDLYVGIIETYFALSRISELNAEPMYYSTEERRKQNGDSYPPAAYRKLKDGRFLFVHLSAEALQRRIRALLSNLSVDKSTLQVNYESQAYLLP